MSYQPCPSAREIRLAFLSTQQAIRMLMELPQVVLDEMRFFDVADTAQREAFGVDAALEELQRDIWQLSQAREKWKAAQRGPRELKTI